jgi:hypothetical protein
MIISVLNNSADTTKLLRLYGPTLGTFLSRQAYPLATKIATTIGVRTTAADGHHIDDECQYGDDGKSDADSNRNVHQ